MKKLIYFLLFVSLAGAVARHESPETSTEPGKTPWSSLNLSETPQEPHYADGHGCHITYPYYASLKPGTDTLYTIRVRAGCEGQFVSKNGFYETWRWYGTDKGYMTLTFDDGILTLRQMDNLL